MKTIEIIKVIDLLNKIANGEKIGYIEYFDRIKICTDITLACKENIIYLLDNNKITLNDKVQIKELENKIEKMPKKGNFTRNQKKIVDKINEIIEKVNELNMNEKLTK